MMLNIPECKKKKRRALLGLSGYSLVLLAFVFFSSIKGGVGKELTVVVVLLFTCWVTFYVHHEILSLKVEILKTIQDTEDRLKDTTE